MEVGLLMKKKRKPSTNMCMRMGSQPFCNITRLCGQNGDIAEDETSVLVAVWFQISVVSLEIACGEKPQVAEEFYTRFGFFCNIMDSMAKTVRLLITDGEKLEPTGC